MEKVLICLPRRTPEEYNCNLGMENKELPSSVKDKIAAIKQFVNESKDDGMDTFYYSIVFDPQTGEHRQTVMKATNSKDSLVSK